VLQGEFVLAHFRVEDADLQLELADHGLVPDPQHVLVSGADELAAEFLQPEWRQGYLAMARANSSLASYKKPTW
jgi:hypothetical protein